MTDLISPDIPSYYTYAIVLFLGAIVAYQTINQRLGDQPDRWAFADTWLVFFAYVIVPGALFWFLDFTGALHDTSLFAGLIIAFGFRQVFAGGVPGIKMPGSSGALWKPFDAWVTQVVDWIATRNKLYADRFDDKVRSLIAGNAALMATFTTLVLAKSTKRPDLLKELAALTTTGDADADRRIALDVQWRDFRRSEPDLYGWLLYKRKIVGGVRYWLWLDNGRSKITLYVVLLAVALSMYGAVAWFTRAPEGTSRIESSGLQFHRWRFLKNNTTERDRWRSRESLERRLRAFGREPIKTIAEAQADFETAEMASNAAEHELNKLPKKTPEAEAAVGMLLGLRRTLVVATAERERAVGARGLVTALVRELGYPSISADQTSAILGLLVDGRTPALNAVFIPEFIDGLRSQNPTVRLETRKTLVALQKADYPAVAFPSDIAAWEPKKGESAMDIDERVRRCQEWWRAASAKYPVGRSAKPTK